MEPQDTPNFSAIDPDSEEVSRMLESLAAASSDLEYLVQRLNEQLNRLGGRLRKTLLNEIRISRQRVESFLESYLSSATREKDELVTQLSQFRQSEIRTILDVGKSSRLQAKNEANRIFSEYSSTIRGDLEEMKALVAAMKTDVDVKADQAKVSALSKECTERIAEMLSNYLRRLPEVAREKLSVVESDILQSQTKIELVLESQLGQLKDELDVIALNSSRELEQTTDAQQVKFANTFKLLDHVEKNLPQRFYLHWKGDEVDTYFDEVVRSFEDSLLSVSDLQSGSFQAKLKNIALQSKVDIQSATRNCQEEMQASQQEFLASLTEQQRATWSRCDALLHKLEQAIETQVESDSGVSERVKVAMKNMAQEFRGKTVQKSHQVEMYFERAIDTMVKNVESFSDETCEQLEHEYSEARKEFGLLYEEIERQLAELQKEVSKIEKAGLGVSRIISAYKKSSIKFPENFE